MGRVGDERQHEWSAVHCAGCRKADGEVRESRKHHPDRLDEWVHHKQGNRSRCKARVPSLTPPSERIHYY